MCSQCKAASREETGGWDVLPKAICLQRERLHRSSQWAGRSVGRGKCVPVCVRRQQQGLESHRCQEGQWAKAKPEEHETPGDVSQVRVVRTCMQMTPK